MRKLLTLFAVCVLAFSSKCQDLATMGLHTAWYKGKVVLSDGEERNGIVSYNDRQGIISYRAENFTQDEPSQLFHDNEIVSLHYFDSEAGRPRNFYSLVYNSARKSIEADQNFSGAPYEMITGSTYLFEVIKEFKDFAVIRRKENVLPIQKKGSTTNIDYYLNKGVSTKQILVQFEKFYFMKADGIFELYLSIAQSDKDGLIFDSSKSKSWYDKSLLEKYLLDHWTEVKDFIKREDLSPKNKTDLFAILDFYEELKSQ